MLNNIAFGIIIGLIFISLILLFCAILIKLYIYKIKNYTQLIYQKDIDFQKAINASIIETQEQVLNNISRDLHDDAGQQLTYINFQIENLKLDSPDLQHTLEPLSFSVGNLSASLRGISHSLSHQLLMQEDLFKAIQAEVERLQKNGVIAIRLTIDEAVKKIFDTSQKIVVYRIFQEAMNNIFKHSKATEVNILLVADPHFKMTIEDNGVGFDPDRTTGGLGRQNMISRAAFINYTTTIVSAPGKGTLVNLSENI